MRIRIAAAALLLAVSAGSALAQKFETLAQMPQMGWNSWNKLGCNVDEKTIREMADAMASSGLKDAGYEYIVIDDCWQVGRDEHGDVLADPVRFASGMKALADYVHGKGLKFGLYSDAGWQTCGKRTGSRGREFQDAKRYAEWGVDYLKYDWCFTDGLKAEGAYLTMSTALKEAGHPILFSLCEWGTSKPWTWAAKVGHSWRTTGDITACFDCVLNHGDWKAFGVLQIMDMQKGLREHAGPGHWNDPDMLEVGNGMSESEDRAHFSIWAMLAAPLIAGNDLRNMSEATRAILANKAVIAVNQDKLGVQGFRFAAKDGVEYWFKPLSGGDWAFMALNRSKQARSIRFDWAKQVLKDKLSGRDAALKTKRYALRDLWKDQLAGDTSKPLTAKIDAHDVLVLRLMPMESAR